MKNLYTLLMVPGTSWDPSGVQVIEADMMTIESGHYVFRQSSVGPFRTIALSRVLEMSTRANPDHQEPAPDVVQAKPSATDLEAELTGNVMTEAEYALFSRQLQKGNGYPYEAYRAGVRDGIQAALR